MERISWGVYTNYLIIPHEGGGLGPAAIVMYLRERRMLAYDSLKGDDYEPV